MSATIQDPYLLSSHTVSSASKSKGKGIAFGERPLVSASYSTSPKHEDGLVTVAVNGDGVHVYNLSDLHLISSHTLGPSTSFWSPPLTTVAPEDGKVYTRTYVTVQTAKDLDSNNAGKVVWSWKEELNGDIGSAQVRKTTTLLHDASYVLSLRSGESILLVAEDGRLTMIDSDLGAKATWAPEKSWHVLRALIFSREGSEIVSGCLDTSDDILLMAAKDGPSLLIQVIGIKTDGTFEAFEPRAIPAINANNLMHISLSPSGFLSVLDSAGTWHAFTLSVRTMSVALQPASEALRLQGLSFIDDAKATKSGKRDSASILSLGSSYVLLAGLSASREIALLLWDMQYGMLQYSQMLPIPSSDKDPETISISLVQGSPSHALLVISPKNIKQSGSQAKANIFVVPFSVPERSTIAGALGRAGKTNPWLVSEQPAVATASNDLTDAEVKQKEELLANLRAAMKEGKLEEADRIFHEWLGPRETKDSRSKVPPPPVTASTLVEEPINTPNVNMEEAVGDVQMIAKTLDHTFVTRLLQIIFQIDDSKGRPHSSKILRYLLSRHVVSYGMIDTDLFSILVQDDDWDTVVQCFQHVPDIPESASMVTLLTVVRHHRTHAADENAMAVDQTERSKIPYIRSFLAHVIDYPASQASLRTAIRKHFTDADDLVVLLTVLAEWMEYHAESDLPLELGDLIKNEHGVPVVKSGAAQKMIRMKGGGRLPAMEHVLDFLQAVLDSSFIQLLQSSSTHDLLRRLSESISPHVITNRDLEALRGPLGPFANAHKKAISDATGGKKREEVDWRKRRKQAQEQTAINLGPYQVEELVF